METPETTEDQEAQEVRDEQKRQIGNLLGGTPPVIEEEEEEEEEDEVLDDGEDLEDAEDEGEEEEEDEDEVVDEDDDDDGEEEEEEEELSEIEALRAQIAEMSTQEGGTSISMPQKETPAADAPAEGEKPEVKKAPATNFVETDDEFDNIVSDRESFNKFLNKFASNIRETTLREAVDVSVQRASSTVTLQQRVSDFYKEHTDLAPFKAYVGFNVNKVASEHPDWGIDQLLTEAAVRSRKGLALSQTAQKAEKTRRVKDKGNKKPAFAGKQKGQARKGTKPEQTDAQRQIADMIAFNR